MAELTVSCPRCGTTQSSEARFCHACGQSFPARLLCPYCGADVSDSARFCNTCGRPLGLADGAAQQPAVPVPVQPAVIPPSPVPPMAAPRKRGGTSSCVWLGIAALLLLCCAGVLGALWWQRGQGIPIPGPKLTELKRQAVGPDGGSVEVSGKVRVDVPAGLLAQDQPLTISSVQDVPRMSLEALKPGAAYDLSLGDQHEFDRDLSVTFNYDPALVNPDYPAEKVLRLARWDATAGIWVQVPCQVNADAHTVTARTRHLSVFSTFWVEQGWPLYDEMRPFLIIYSSKTIPHPFGEKIPAEYGGNYDSSDLFFQDALKARLQGTSPDVPLYVKETAAFLSIAYQGYKRESYTKFVERQADIDVFVENVARPEQSALTGVITLWTKCPNRACLAHFTAHELFHTLQTEYYGVTGMMNKVGPKWWIEATAQYAPTTLWKFPDKGYWVGQDAANPPSMDISYDYLTRPLDTLDNLHEYETGHLVKYLVDNRVDFPGLVEGVWAMQQEKGYTLEAVGSYLKDHTSRSLPQWYREFAAHFLFENGKPRPELEPVDTLNGPRPSKLEASSSRLSSVLQLRRGYTAQVWGILVEVPAPQPSRSLSVARLNSSLDSAIIVDVYVRDRDQSSPQKMPPVATLLKDGEDQAAAVEISDRDVLYIVAVNTSEQDESVQIVVSEGSLPAPTPKGEDLSGICPKNCKEERVISDSAYENCCHATCGQICGRVQSLRRDGTDVYDSCYRECAGH